MGSFDNLFVSCTDMLGIMNDLSFRTLILCESYANFGRSLYQYDAKYWLFVCSLHWYDGHCFPFVCV